VNGSIVTRDLKQYTIFLNTCVYTYTIILEDARKGLLIAVGKDALLEANLRRNINLRNI
jgi:hypothetical protein